MELTLANIKNTDNMYRLLKMSLDLHFEVDIWLSKILEHDYHLFQHEGIADLLLETPLTKFNLCDNRQIPIFVLSVGYMNDYKMADKIKEYITTNIFANSHVPIQKEILIQCLFNGKIKTAQVLFDECVSHFKNGKYDLFDVAGGIPDIIFSNLHFIENGNNDLMPCWKPKTMEWLDNIGAPFALYIPPRIMGNTYIMDYTKIIGQIKIKSDYYPSYNVIGRYWYNQQHEQSKQNVVVFHSKELMLQWWEQVQKMVKN